MTEIIKHKVNVLYEEEDYNIKSVVTLCVGWKTLELDWMGFYWRAPVSAAPSPQKPCEAMDETAPACNTASNLEGHINKRTTHISTFCPMWPCWKMKSLMCDVIFCHLFSTLYQNKHKAWLWSRQEENIFKNCWMLVCLTCTSTP